MSFGDRREPSHVRQQELKNPRDVLRYACRDSCMKLDILKKARFDGQSP